MEKVRNYISRLIEKGGPGPYEYDELNHIINNVKQEEIEEFRNNLKPVLNKNTLQGWAFIKPFGYSGDHIMIDKIYSKYVNGNHKYKNWDLYFHSHSAPRAVRNRKRNMI